MLFSTHQDHDGVRAPVANDSIYNGADDNATGCAALLAIMRAFQQEPARRSALFVYHGAEERGLLGSRYYSAHPTVPREEHRGGAECRDDGAATPPTARPCWAPWLTAPELLRPGENGPGRQPGRAPEVQA